MKQILFSLVVAATALSAMTGCDKNAATTRSTAEAKKYTCTMHPEVVTDAPGKCPKCSMELVAKK